MLLDLSEMSKYISWFKVDLHGISGIWMITGQPPIGVTRPGYI